jgi:hypothetical protein
MLLGELALLQLEPFSRLMRQRRLGDYQSLEMDINFKGRVDE